jgi:hypothetical protein
MIFVLDNPDIHIFLRGIAIVAGVVLMHQGLECKNKIVFTIGLVTVVVDSFTFCKSIKLLKSNQNKK